MRTCKVCGAEKNESEFYVKDSKTGRLSTSCKACHSVNVMKWQNDNREKVRGYIRKSCKKAYAENPEKYRKKSAQRRLLDPDAHRKRVKKSYQKMQANITEHETARRKRNSLRWCANNREKMRLASENWRKNNPSKHCAKQNRRRAKKLFATPSWLSPIHLAQTQEHYDIALARSVQTGVKYEVDHIHPLQGANVCGLHVPWNLQVITAKENRLKWNKLIQDDRKC